MLKAIKLRLYPNKSQEIYIGKLLGSYRFVYNQCLSQKINVYKEDKINLGLKELGSFFHHDLTNQFEWLKEYNTKVLKQSIINMLDAYKNFFRTKQGFPRFKSKHDNKLSCRFPVEAISKRNDFTTKRLNLTKDLKGIKFKTSEKNINYLTKYQDGIRSATLTKTKGGDFYISILVQSDEVLTKSRLNTTIGLDLGIKDFIVTSEGQIYDNLKLKRNNQKKLNRLHRSLSRKQKGSKNRNKERIKLAKFYERLNNIKENYLHLITNQLIDENQIISIEDLNVKGMLKNQNLAKSIQEISLYRFKQILKYKADWYGRSVIEIDRWFPSSQLCSECGYRYSELTLKEREWTCPRCGQSHHRDLNAAINIKNEGLRLFKNTLPLREIKDCGDETIVSL